MKIITINLPEKYLSAIQTLISTKLYPSRSEAIRSALRDFLDDELKMFNNLSEVTFGKIIRGAKIRR